MGRFLSGNARVACRIDHSDTDRSWLSRFFVLSVVSHCFFKQTLQYNASTMRIFVNNVDGYLAGRGRFQYPRAMWLSRGFLKPGVPQNHGFWYQLGLISDDLGYLPTWVWVCKRDPERILRIYCISYMTPEASREFPIPAWLVVRLHLFLWYCSIYQRQKNIERNSVVNPWSKREKHGPSGKSCFAGAICADLTKISKNLARLLCGFWLQAPFNVDL